MKSKTLDSFIEIGAGCQGNSTECAYCKEIYFIADMNYTLIPETLIKTFEVAISPYPVRSCRIEWHNVDSEVKRMIGYAHEIVGSNEDTQSQSRYFYTITQIKESIVEIN